MGAGRAGDEETDGGRDGESDGFEEDEEGEEWIAVLGDQFS